MIVMRRFVKVDGKVRTDMNFPAGFMDVVTIEKAGRAFRLLYNTKGHFALHKINDVESKYKLCKVVRKATGPKATAGVNLKAPKGSNAVPYIVTHDARTIRYVDPLIKNNDTVKVDLETGKVVGFLKFQVGNQAMVTRGSNIGRVGAITHIERHPGSFDIVQVKDARGNVFATRVSNIFVIGEGNNSWVSLPKDKGIKLNALEDRERRVAYHDRK